MIQYWYVPIIFLSYSFLAYVSNKHNFWVIWALGAIPYWALVNKYSKDVVYDGIVFDLVVTVSYTVSILYFTRSFYKLEASNYFGLALVFFGLYIFKRGL